MSSHVSDIRQNIFFLSLIGIVCFVISRPYYALDSFFKKHYQQEEQHNKEEIARLISIEEWSMHRPGQMEKMRPYYEHMRRIDSLTRQTAMYVDTAKRPIDPDQLQQRIEENITALLSEDSYDSTVFRPLLYRAMNDAYVKKTKGGWVRNLLCGQSSNQKELVLCLLRSSLYDAARIVTRRLAEVSAYRCCNCFDTTMGLFVPDNPLLNIGDTLRGKFMLATLPLQDNISYYEHIPLKNTRNVGQWNITAGDVGDYTVHGYSVHEMPVYNVPGFYTQSDTLPWSFQYRVVAKGISLVLGAGQSCYRQGDNPITISIPGYLPHQIGLWAKGATFINNGNGHWSFTITDKHRGHIIVYADATDIRGHTSTVYASRFPITDLPLLSIGIDGRTTPAIYASDMTRQHLLTLLTHEGESAPELDVACYKLCIISADNKLQGDFSITGNKLNLSSPELNAACNRLTAGARLYITHIMVRTRNGDSLAGSPLAIALN